jgi:PAS domain S-box-containing protein
MNGAAFREIIRNLAVGVLIADADGSVYYANPAAVYITGFTEDEFRRGGLSVLSAEQEGTEIKNVILDAAQDGYPREKEVFFRRKNGTSGWMAVNTAKTARYGAETRVITFIDVTEIKQAEQTLWRYGAHLETRIDGQSKRLREAERMATLGETALMLGHDLKNPLQALLNINFLLKEIYRLSENEARKYLDGHNMAGLLDMFERQSLYMKRIVDNLQIYARREKSSDEVISLVDSVKQVVSLQRDSDVKFSLEIEDGVPRVNLGTTDAQRILTNLIGNAVEAMSGPGTVTIKVYRNKKYSCVRISDTGPGIENGNLGKLFTPLFSTKSKGMGMGLAAVKKLTESYGGSIMSANGLDGGAVFTLQFPFQES